MWSNLDSFVAATIGTILWGELPVNHMCTSMDEPDGKTSAEEMEREREQDITGLHSLQSQSHSNASRPKTKCNPLINRHGI